MGDLRIAIIGAGASGLTAAHELRKLGVGKVTVFEKEMRVGGKACTVELNGRLYDIGAVWTTPDYNTVHRISHEVDARQHAVNPLNVMTLDGRVMNAVLHALREENPFRLARDTLNFWRVARRFPRIRQPGFHAYHPDFFRTVDELSTKYRFTSLAKAMAPTMSACGYGFYEEIPALYWMKLMEMLLHFGLRPGTAFGSLKSFDQGYQSLWQGVAKGLDVRVGSEVTSMKRSGNGHEAIIEISTDEGTDTFDKVIVAAPLESAHKFMDFCKKERELFGKIRTLRYIVSAVHCDSNAHVAFAKNIRPARLGHVNAAVKKYPDSDVCVFYQLVDHSTSQEQALDILRADLSELGIEFGEVYYQKTWEYFPHVAREDLHQGFYDELEAMQGDRGTYYIGSLLSFETVEHTSAYASALVERCFRPASQAFR